jgi:hypothetical protein
MGNSYHHKNGKKTKYGPKIEQSVPGPSGFDAAKALVNFL